MPNPLCVCVRPRPQQICHPHGPSTNSRRLCAPLAYQPWTRTSSDLCCQTDAKTCCCCNNPNGGVKVTRCMVYKLGVGPILIKTARTCTDTKSRTPYTIKSHSDSFCAPLSTIKSHSSWKMCYVRDTGVSDSSVSTWSVEGHECCSTPPLRMCLRATQRCSAVLPEWAPLLCTIALQRVGTPVTLTNMYGPIMTCSNII